MLMVLLAILAPFPLRAQDMTGPGSVTSSETPSTVSKSPFHQAGFPKGRIHASAASTGFDAVYYDLALDLRFEPPYLHGRTFVQGRVTAAMDVLALDLVSSLRVDSVRSVDDHPLDFTHTADVLRIDLGETRAAGETVAVDVFYQGLPDQGGFGTFVFGALPNRDPYAWSLSEPYGAREWWASKDHPSDKADSVRVSATVPASLRVGSNGLLFAAVDNGDGTATYDWRSRYPIASYLVSIAAGRYDVYEQTYVRPDSLGAVMGPLELPVVHYTYRNTNSFEGVDIYSGWKRVVDVLPVLESWFGAYPFPAEKYGHAQFTFGGGMEHQTMSSMGGSSVTLIAHELAHQWFGDMITMRRWPHLWLNEGFATYAELLYWQTRPDLYPGMFEQRFDLYYNRALNASGTLVVEDTTSVSNLFNSSRVYAKGGIVLHMLRGLLGESAFRGVLLAYTQDEAVRYGTATTADFQQVAESISGESLDTFFRQWVTEGTGYPVYEVAWGYETVGAGYELTVTIEQTQEMPTSSVGVFEMPVTLALQTEGGEQRVRVPNDQRTQSYVFQVTDRPSGVVFDPDRLILRNATVRTVPVEGTSGAPSRTHIAAAYPNPAASAIHVRIDLAEAAGVQLTLRDVLGRRVRVLMDRPLQAGTYEEAFAVSEVAPGVYLLRLDAGGHHSTRPVAVVR